MSPISPRQIIEAGRVLAGQSRDQYATPLHRAIAQSNIPRNQRDAAFVQEMHNRMNLVMDCFNTGAAMMLKILHGDATPEPWSEEYSHENRLRELLTQYGLIAEPQGSQVPEPSSATSSTQK